MKPRRFRFLSTFTIKMLIWCLLAMRNHPAVAQKADRGPLHRSINSLTPDIMDSVLHGVAPDLPPKLAAKRKEVINYTREHIPYQQLSEHEWAWPVIGLYEWSTRYEHASHDECEKAIRELFDILREATPVNKEVAVLAMGRIMYIYGDLWMGSIHAPKCLAFIDEVEEWAMREPAQPAHWQIGIATIQAHAILNRDLFPPDRHEWLIESREQRLRRWMTEPHMFLNLKTRAVTQWGNAYYLLGDGETANRLLTAWWRRHGDDIDDSSFYAVWMKTMIYGIMDWDRAGRLLEHINGLIDRETCPRRKAGYDRALGYYYDSIMLPDYEIRRLRYVQVTERREQMEKLRALGENIAKNDE